MHTINKVLIGLILFFGLVFFVFASAVLQRQNQLRSDFNRLEASVDAAQKQNDQLRHGSPGQPGVFQLIAQLNLITEGRGNVWYKVTPGQVEPATGVVPVTIEAPAPHQLAPDKVVYAFGDRDAGGGYLGEFRVTASAEKQATLTPTGKLAPGELERLQKNPGPWTLYDVMPADSHALFAELPEDQLKALLPEATLGEYLKDGQAADPNDPADRVSDGKYVRQLRDYVGEFHEYGRQRSIYVDRIAAERKDNEYLSNQLKRGEASVALRARQIADAKAHLAAVSQERDAVIAHRKSLEAQLAEVENSVAALTNENERLAARLTQWQLDVLSRANQRTASLSAGN
jgi:hypothetical protein